jgi:hypothetical protein
MNTNQTTEKTNRAAQLLTDTITSIKNSDDFKRALEFKAQFHHYSFANCFLIYQQCPHATLVAGYRKWQELNRQVKKGEKSIAIFAPLIRKEKVENMNEKIPMVFGFRSVSVFDVSQTEGEKLPQLPRPKMLEGDSLNIQLLIGGAKLYAKSQGISVAVQDLEKGVSYYSLKDNRIVLSPKLPPLHTLKCLVHQLAYATIQGNSFGEEHRINDILEAEATAYLTLQDLGLDTSDYTFPLLETWTDDPHDLLKLGEAAYQTSRQLLSALKKYLPSQHTELARAA